MRVRHRGLVRIGRLAGLALGQGSGVLVAPSVETDYRPGRTCAQWVDRHFLVRRRGAGGDGRPSEALESTPRAVGSPRNGEGTPLSSTPCSSLPRVVRQPGVTSQAVELWDTQWSTVTKSWYPRWAPPEGTTAEAWGPEESLRRITGYRDCRRGLNLPQLESHIGNGNLRQNDANLLFLDGEVHVRLRALINRVLPDSAFDGVVVGQVHRPTRRRTSRARTGRSRQRLRRSHRRGHDVLHPRPAARRGRRAGRQAADDERPVRSGLLTGRGGRSRGRRSRGPRRAADRRPRRHRRSCRRAGPPRRRPA